MRQPSPASISTRLIKGVDHKGRVVYHERTAPEQGLPSKAAGQPLGNAEAAAGAGQGGEGQGGEGQADPLASIASIATAAMNYQAEQNRIIEDIIATGRNYFNAQTKYEDLIGELLRHIKDAEHQLRLYTTGYDLNPKAYTAKIRRTAGQWAIEAMHKAEQLIHKDKNVDQCLAKEGNQAIGTKGRIKFMSDEELLSRSRRGWRKKAYAGAYSARMGCRLDFLQGLVRAMKAYFNAMNRWSEQERSLLQSGQRRALQQRVVNQKELMRLTDDQLRSAFVGQLSGTRKQLIVKVIQQLKVLGIPVVNNQEAKVEHLVQREAQQGASSPGLGKTYTIEQLTHLATKGNPVTRHIFQFKLKEALAKKKQVKEQQALAKKQADDLNPQQTLFDWIDKPATYLIPASVRQQAKEGQAVRAASASNPLLIAGGLAVIGIALLQKK